MNPQAMLHSRPGTQRGAIMVVSLLLLLVMTVLALTASQTTTLQERMAGNARDTDLAFQAAEAGLRDAEAQLTAEVFANSSGRPEMCGQGGSCNTKERSLTFKEDFARAESFWSANTRQYGGAGKQLGDVTSDPLLYTEIRGVVNDTLTPKPGAAESGVAYYTHTVRAKGGTDTATVVLESISAERFPR